MRKECETCEYWEQTYRESGICKCPHGIEKGHVIECWDECKDYEEEVHGRDKEGRERVKKEV